MAIKKPIVNYNGKLKELQTGDSLPSSGGVSVTELEIDFGTRPTTERRFTIIDASATNLSRIQVLPSGSPATGRGQDDWLWDTITFAAKGNTGDFTLYAKASGRISGKRKIFYTINN